MKGKSSMHWSENSSPIEVSAKRRQKGDRCYGLSNGCSRISN